MTTTEPTSRPQYRRTSQAARNQQDRQVVLIFFAVLIAIAIVGITFGLLL